MNDRIERTIDLKAPVERVWRAITDHEEFGTWFRVRLDGPFAPGAPATGRVTYPGYEHVVWRAVVREMIPPRLFSFTWHPYGIDQAKDYSKEPPTLVEFRLERKGEGTLLTLTESGFSKIPAERRLEAFRMNDRGWATQMEDIQRHVEQTS